MDPTPAPFDKHRRASDTDRERVAEVLLGTLPDGRLTAAELDERLAAAYAAKTVGDLEPLVADLAIDLPSLLFPVGREPAISPDGLARTEWDDRIGGRPGSHLSVALIGAAERTGAWVLPVAHTAFCYLGRITIDLREARFAQPRCAIVAVSVLGVIRIVVPPDITVRVNGIGLVGNFSGPSLLGAPTAPVVHITGVALWGNVIVVREARVRQDEPAGDAELTGHGGSGELTGRRDAELPAGERTADSDDGAPGTARH